MSQALVVGGTGPTGPHVVNGLLARGHEVTILHSGRHESDLIPDSVTHIHTDAFDIAAVDAALAGRSYDAVLAMYGRLRDLAPLFAGRCDRFLAIGGMPVYRGFGWPESNQPRGMALPTREDAPRAMEGDNPKVLKMVETEDVVFVHHPNATLLRYPRIYGPGQVIPKEWSIVRRLVDGRTRFIVPDGGRTLNTLAYSVNAANAVLCALDAAPVAGGRRVNVSDECTVSVRQWIEMLAEGLGLGHAVSFVDLPWSLARSSYPWFECTPDHRVASVEQLRGELGYRDVLPVHDALALTARDLRDNPLTGNVAEAALQDPFNYAAEDALIAAWDAAEATLLPFAEAADTGFVDRYAKGSVDAHLVIDR